MFLDMKTHINHPEPNISESWRRLNHVQIIKWWGRRWHSGIAVLRDDGVAAPRRCFHNVPTHKKDQNMPKLSGSIRGIRGASAHIRHPRGCSSTLLSLCTNFIDAVNARFNFKQAIEAQIC